MELSLQRLGLLQKVGGKLDTKIQEVGLQQAMAALIRKTGSGLIVKGKTVEVNKILSKEAVIVVSNHPGESDALTIVAAINDRPDINMVIDSSFLKMLPHWDAHLIPVYVHHHNERDNRGHYKNWLFKQLHPNQCYGKEAAHQKNIKSIKLAAEKVNQGELLVMFPSAGRMDGRWFGGIGYLLKDVSEKTKAKVIMAHIDGSSDLDYLKMIPLIGRFLKPITIHFSKPISVNKIRRIDPKESTAVLEKLYQEWVNKSTWHRQN